MGCTSTAMVQSRRVVPLPPDTINSLIDKFPAIILLKIKQKFDHFLQKETKDITHLSFLKLYSSANLNSQMHRRLYAYFNDNSKSNIKFRQFIVKYATITKCEASVFYNILFQIYKDSVDREIMNEQQFSNFLKNETQYFAKHPSDQLFPLGLSDFINILTECEFKVEEYQARFILTTESDIPFKQIGQELSYCDFNDFTPGEEYYIISESWFNKWSFYYQEADHNLYKQKSTKILPQIYTKRSKMRESVRNERKPSQALRSSELGNILVEPPKTIDFDDIESQYWGQLKQNLKISVQIKIVTPKLWSLLCSLHSAEQSFKRFAINIDTLEYYPKAIYYVQADKSGKFIQSSQQMKFLSSSQQISSLFNQQVKTQKCLYAKNFGQMNWRLVQQSQTFGEISYDPRFFIVAAQNGQKFLQRNSRSQIKIQNLQPGDRVFGYFPYIKAYSQAFILKIVQQKYKVHFRGYSFRYQIQISKEDISIAQFQAVVTFSKMKNGSIIKGIPNIGNTCFINSVIQCLIATPVLNGFLIKYQFNQNKQPLGFGLSQIAKSLLNNEVAKPQPFKKLIDIHLPDFSGYNQHDAQQFLNMLLNKLNDQILEKPTVIDYLFGGKMKSILTCSACKNLKNIEQKMYILSLPIPQSEYNYFSIIVVPVNYNKIRKILFKLHKHAVLADYCNAFEDRIEASKKDYIFVEATFNSLKKVKQEIHWAGYQQKLITDVGIVPNNSLLAFQKIPNRFYSQMLARKPKNEQFRDFQPKAQAAWTICRTLKQKSEAGNENGSGIEKYKEGQLIIQYISPENDIQKAKIEESTLKKLSTGLGMKTDINYKKIILRKYNSALKKFQSFGLEFLAGIPRWASYNDLVEIAERYLQKLKEKGAKHYDSEDGEKKGDYIIRFLDPTKARCIFCQIQIPYLNLEQKDLAHCCNILQKDIPYPWIAKSKSFWLFIDWIDFSKCNSSFCSSIQIDQISKLVQKSKQEQHISLDACMKMQSQAEQVQMQCDKCKQKQQIIQHLIGTMPNILVVHMKQFRYTTQGHLIKLDVRLKWQEVLDSSKYSITTNGKLYELFAVVKHSGSSQSGHYTCMAKRKHPFENKKTWVNFDDEFTTIVKQSEKFIDDAYLLFYKKVDMPTSSLVIYSDFEFV